MRFVEYVESNECVFVNVAANMTQQFQTLDLSVNGPAKMLLTKKIEEWYADEVRKLVSNGKSIYNIKVPLKFPILKSLHVNWVKR